MNKLYSTILLISLLLSGVVAEMTVLEKSPGRLVLKYSFDEPQLQYDRNRLADIITVDECGSAVQTKEGVILPAEMVNFAADSRRAVAVTVQPTQKGTLTYDNLFKTEKSLYPLIKTGSLKVEPQLRKIRGAEIYSLFVTPILFDDKSNRFNYYKELVVTISFSENSARSITAAPLDIKQAVVNPEALRIGSSRSSSLASARREGTYIKSDEKALVFSVDNGISTTTDQETNVENSCNGLYRVTPAELSYLGSNIPLAQLRVRAANRMVYDSVTPAPELIPHALQEVDYLVRDKNSDGLFNGTDELLFYGSAIHFWYFRTFVDKIDTLDDGLTVTYDTTFAGVWDYRFNDFDYRRNYWISVGAGSAMESISPVLTPGVSQTSGLKLRRVKIPTNLTTPDEVFMGHSSRDWKWQTVSQSVTSFEGTLEVFNPDLTDSIGVRMWIPKKRKSYNSTALVNIGTLEYPLELNGGVSKWYYGPITAEDFNFTATLTSGKDFYYDISSYDYRYRRVLDMAGSPTLHFYSEEARGAATYTITNLPVGFTTILRIDELNNTTSLVDTISTGGTYQFTDSTGLGYEYLLVSEAGYKSIRTATNFPAYTYTRRNSYVVRSITTHTQNNDYIIVSSPELLAHSDTIASYKAQEGFNPVIFSTEDIYREFSGGIKDPTAIRNAMSYLRASNGELKYLLLFGGGHYDYKGYHSTEVNHIPPYLDDSEILIEDYYGYLDAGEDVDESPLSDMFVGRIPAKNVTDADNYIKKVHEVYANATEGADWKNRILLLNDDDSQKGKPDPVRGHEVSSDLVNDEIVAKKKDLLIQELNFFEYPFGGNWTKPKVKEALFKFIKEGTLLINYFGHGAYHAISDEDVFLSSDLISLRNYNKGKYFIFSAFSCSVGLFDLPEKDAIASELLFIEDGGAIASVSSTRTAYHDSNQKFGRAYFRELFDTTDAVRPLGMAYGIAKTFHNLNRYALLGDPSYSPYKGRYEMPLTLKNKNGVVANTFQIFDKVTIEGVIPAQVVAPDTNWVILTLQNQERLDEKRKDGGGPEDRDVTYDIPGELLYKSNPLPIVGNSFSHTITVPRSISQDTLGMSFKAYVWNKGVNVASAIVDTFLISGINLQELDTTDKVGPQIKTRINITDEIDLDGSVDFADAGSVIEIDGFNLSPSQVDGADSTQEVQFEFHLTDSSGIDYFYNNAGEGITMEIVGVRGLENLNEQFNGSEDNKSGVINLTIGRDEFPGVGQYDLIITARDILGNVSREKYILDVKSMDQDQYTMGDFFCYPSPAVMGTQTRFWFNPTNNQVTKASLKIYTLDGRLIRHVKDVNSGYTWDLTDQKGNKLTPNVYLYRLFIERELRPDNSSTIVDDGYRTEVIKSPIRKLVIYPPSN